MTGLILVSAHWICGISVWGERLEMVSGKGEHSNIPLHIQQWHLPIPLNLNLNQSCVQRAPPLLEVFIKKREEFISI